MEQIKDRKEMYKICTQEQLEYYMAFITKHPELSQTKRSPVNPLQMKKLWEELAGNLNSMIGPTRNTVQWIVSLRHIKEQRKSKARRMKMSLIGTAGGGPVRKFTKVPRFKEGSIAIYRANSVKELRNTSSTIGTRIPTKCITNNQDIIETLNITHGIHHTVTETNKIASETYNRRTRNSRLLISMKERHECERKFWEERLKVQKELAGAIKDLRKVLDKFK
uniref:Myb_DNA-bind_5 domain-containing protein n=1 Tax=Glossina brevipalpis TaxID=37001 RepID=A0A1A9WRE1_9MUSC